MNIETPDYLCLLETRISIEQLRNEIKPDKMFPNYYTYWNSSLVRKGYSGVAVISKDKPISVKYGLDNDHYDLEGRVITLEYEKFNLVTVYVPNAGINLKRLQYKLEFEKLLLDYLIKLKNKKNTIIAGDFNVAHTELDIYDTLLQDEVSGYTLEERSSFQNYLDNGFIDTFRFFYPDKSYFSFWADSVNLGLCSHSSNYWRRMNYFLVNNNPDFLKCIKDSSVIFDYIPADHPPIKLTINI